MKNVFTASLICLLFCVASAQAGFDMNKLAPLTTKLPKPTATLEKFDIKQISLKDITFTFGIGIANPYLVNLTLNGVDIDFSVESNKITHTTAAQGVVIPSKGKQTNYFDVTITYESIIQLVKDYTSHDFLKCDTDVVLKIPLPKIKGLPKTADFSFRLSQKIPAIKPKVSIAKFSVTLPTEQDVKASLQKAATTAVKSLDAKKVQAMFSTILQGGTVPAPVVKPQDIDLKFKVGFDIVLQNEAKAQFDFTSLDFNFQVNSNQLITGAASQVQKTGTTTIIHVVNEFSSKNLNPSVLNAFKTGAGSFSLSGNTVLQLPPTIVNHPLKLEFKEDGNFKLR